MLMLPGKWILLANQTEFCVKDGVCVWVSHKGAFWSRDAAAGWRLVGVMGPPRKRDKDSILIGDSLIFARNGEVFYTPPIEEIQKYKKAPKPASPKEKPRPQAKKKDRGELREPELYLKEGAMLDS